MIAKILVPLDGSEYADRALNYAIELAKKFQSEILLVHVVPTTSAFMAGSGALDAPLVTDLSNHLEESGRSLLASAEGRLGDASVKTSTRIVSGNPANEILRIAKDEKADLIVMGDRGLGAVERFFLGSVSDKVSSHSACPVLLVKG